MMTHTATLTNNEIAYNEVLSEIKNSLKACELKVIVKKAELNKMDIAMIKKDIKQDYCPTIKTLLIQEQMDGDEYREKKNELQKYIKKTQNEVIDLKERVAYIGAHKEDILKKISYTI